VTLVVLGAFVLFTVYAMVHFVHEWYEDRRSKRNRDSDT
jgi:hypothetical protein